MLRIGFCDDVQEDLNEMERVCEAYLKERNLRYEFERFSSGEELMEKLLDKGFKRVDLLFLDIEMDGMDGLEVKERLKNEPLVWRIVFVSNHREAMQQAFGLKIIGFVHKPFVTAEITRWLDVVLKEQEENQEVHIHGLNQIVYLDEINYLKGGKNYTEIHFADGREKALVIGQIGKIYKQLDHQYFCRVHKSYIVNFLCVKKFRSDITLLGCSHIIPKGRKYKDDAERRYDEFIAKKARSRI